MLRTDFQWIELDAIGHHQRDRVAAPHPDPGQSGSDLADLVGILAPRECHGIAGCAQGDRVGIDRRIVLERGWKRFESRTPRRRFWFNASTSNVGAGCVCLHHTPTV